ncbi:MAG: hypothetical protein ACK518_00720 [bacterium]|jgi:hypothetical protein
MRITKTFNHTSIHFMLKDGTYYVEAKNISHVLNYAHGVSCAIVASIDLQDLTYVKINKRNYLYVNVSALIDRLRRIKKGNMRYSVANELIDWLESTCFNSAAVHKDIIKHNLELAIIDIDNVNKLEIHLATALNHFESLATI